MKAAAATHELFAIAAPGLERIVAAEIAALGVTPKIVQGGVEFSGGDDVMFRANLELRTASRVVVRVASFRARTFFELERHAAQVPWKRFLKRGQAVAFRVTASKSKLYHEGAIAQRLMTAAVAAGAVAATPGAPVAGGAAARPPGAPVAGGAAARPPDAPVAGGAVAATPNARAANAGAAQKADPDDVSGNAQLFVVRFLRDECVISADSSGALLHLRGYRQAVAKAPMRETLAAAMLVGSGWIGTSPLLDPMCGSGTIAIEAALLARRIAPGIAIADRTPRAYRFEQWPSHDASLWSNIVGAARDRILERSPVQIVASDRDPGAVEATRSNAARAGVEADIEAAQLPLSAARVPSPSTWIVTNPPYGMRVAARDPRNLFAALGRLAISEAPDGAVVVIASDVGAARHSALPLHPVAETRNGGIAVSILSTRML